MIFLPESDSVCLKLTSQELAQLMLMVGYASVKAGELNDQRSIAFVGAIYKACRDWENRK